MISLAKFDPFTEGNKGQFELSERVDGLCNIWRIAPVKSTEEDIENGYPDMIMRWVVAWVYDPMCHRWNAMKSCLEEIRSH